MQKFNRVGMPQWQLVRICFTQFVLKMLMHFVLWWHWGLLALLNQCNSQTF